MTAREEGFVKGVYRTLKLEGNPFPENREKFINILKNSDISQETINYYLEQFSFVDTTVKKHSVTIIYDVEAENAVEAEVKVRSSLKEAFGPAYVQDIVSVSCSEQTDKPNSSLSL